jgi:hypothetical protein
MAKQYTITIFDQLLRFDTTNDDVVVTMLPFASTPNAPYQVQKTSVGDGHTVTVQPDPTTRDKLLSDGSLVVLDDDNLTAIIRIPADGASPAFVSMGGVSSGGSGGAVNVPAPEVSIVGPAEILFRDNNQLEVDVAWAPASNATAVNFEAVSVYLEDPDISSGPNVPLDGTALLNGTRQTSGAWTPVLVNTSSQTPAVVLLDATTGGVAAVRNVRIYLAAFGPYSQPTLIRANLAGATPNIMVEIGQGPASYQSGMEWAFLCTNPHVAIATDYNRPDPNYSLTYTYTPPDPTIPLPKGVNQFGGCRIVNIQLDSSGNPIFPGQDTGISVPVAQSQSGYLSPTYNAGTGGGKFRAYFCSEDNATPLGSHINSLVNGVTPFFEVDIPLVAPAPDVTAFSISGQTIVYLLNQTFVAHAQFSWTLPSASAGAARYAGVYLYLVNVTGGSPPLTTFPAKLSAQQSNIDTNVALDISRVPSNPEVWTIAAISVDAYGQLSDDPTKYGQAGFHSPTVTWNVGPPVPSAPLVTINAGAAATPTQSVSADGVGMVSFQVGSWTNPPANQFGGSEVAMVINSDTTKPTYWSVPVNATSFQTPAMPSFGNVGGAAVPVDFYIVSDDPQGHKNAIQGSPVISVAGGYTPQAGAIIPARSGWFDPTEFEWPAGLAFTALQFAAQKIYVGSILRVGGGAGTDAASFAGQQDGQIAVYNASNQLRAWIGQQQPGQGDQSAIYGGWFGQLWVGGSSPLNAPLFVDYQGIIEVGGIAAANGATYPYISVRDETGLEAGRIGAMISTPSGSPGDNVGGAPPVLTAGAWFTQLAVGGSNLSNWAVKIVPTTTGNPLGSDFYMRNVYLLSIDYAAKSGNPANAEYKLEFGNSVWMAGGLPAGVWQFPGIHIYEVEGGNNFGATFINRGMVLRGTGTQNYSPLVSLVTWNGDQGGSDYPAQFFGQLTMANPLTPSFQGVVIASGSAASSGGPVIGNAYMRLGDVNNNIVIAADTTGCTAVAFSTVAHGQVIDSAGNWHGQPIAGSQTPWTSNIAGAGFSLSNVGSIQVNGNIAAATYNVGGTQVINASAQWTQAVSTSQGVTCGSLSTSGTGNYGELDCGHLVMELVSGAAPHLFQYAAGGARIDCASSGIWGGNGVQANAEVLGNPFGIYGIALGWPQTAPAQGGPGAAPGATDTFTTANGKTVTVCGGIIIKIA